METDGVAGNSGLRYLMTLQMQTRHLSSLQRENQGQRPGGAFTPQQERAVCRKRIVPVVQAT